MIAFIFYHNKHTLSRNKAIKILKVEIKLKNFLFFSNADIIVLAIIVSSFNDEVDNITHIEKLQIGDSHAELEYS